MLSACKSSISTVVTVKPNFTSVKYDTVCNNMLPYSWSAKTYTAAGSYNDIALGSNGCDSIATLHLFIKDTTTSITNKTVCNNMLPYNWNSVDYNTAGTYTWKGTNIAGCDSVATLILTISDTTISTTTTSSCDSMIWSGTTYYSSGIYTWKGTNIAGCDSVATLNLTINVSPAPAFITTISNNVSIPAMGIVYACSIVANAVSYNWSYTGTGATIATGQGTINITVDFAANATDGDMQVVAVSAAGCNSILVTTHIVLPITLSNFVVTKVNNTALLKWKSATEIISRNFEVQRSIDGKTFETIGSVAAKGFASEYSFTDNKLTIITSEKLTIYYRLKQIDKDGKFEYSVIRNLELGSRSGVISVYPNPAHSLLTINCSLVTGNATAVITDVYGKQVLKQIINNQLSIINVKQFPKGVYIVKALMNNGDVKTEKLVVE